MIPKIESLRELDFLLNIIQKGPFGGLQRQDKGHYHFSSYQPPGKKKKSLAISGDG